MSDNDALSHLYRQLPAEQPSTRLDAKVLAAVNTELAASRAQRARSQRRWRYQVPLATAATVVLAVALFLRQPETQQELLSPRSKDGVAMYKELAREAGSDSAAYKKAPSTIDELRVMQPPLMSAPPPVPAPPMVAMMDLPAPVSSPTVAPESTNAAIASAEPPPARSHVPNMAGIARMGIIADGALPKMQLGALLNEAAGMPAKEFCERLQALWIATDAVPDCPTNDGQHQWPAPLAITWQVTGGHVQSAELRR
jgi:hypothetical protein